MRNKPAVSLAGLLVLALFLAGCFGGTNGLGPGTGSRTAPDVTAPRAFPGDDVTDRDLAAHVPGQVIVGVDSEQRAGAIAEAVDGVLLRYLDMNDKGIALIELNDAGASITDAMRALKKEDGVRFAEANFTEYSLPYVKEDPRLVTGLSGETKTAGPGRPGFGPSDEDEEEEAPPKSFYERFQYGPRITKAVEAWEQDILGRGTIVAVIDTGVASDHPDLAGKVLPGYNPDQPESGTEDWHGHGTHVAATAAGWFNDEAGERMTVGIAPEALVLPLRVFNSDGATSIAIAEAMLVAADPTLVGLSSPRADVANMSLGGAVYSQALQDAIHFAVERDVVVVASMGNESHEQIRYPAAYQGVIGVAATNARDEVTDFSTAGRHASIGAPGEFVFAATPGNWAWMSGTSMAAPHVSGAAALLREQRPNATPMEIKALLERTADDTGETARKIGHGRLNIARALADDDVGTGYGMLELYVFDEYGFGVPDANIVLYKGDEQVATGRTGGYFEGMFYEGVAWFFGLEPGSDYRLAVSLAESMHGTKALYEINDIEIDADDMTVRRLRVHLGD